jgi:hypothetical protein
MQYEMFTAKNPFLNSMGAFADRMRGDRRIVPNDNPMWQAQEQLSTYMEKSLDAYRDWRDGCYESAFYSVYGSPLLQALVGLKGSGGTIRVRSRNDSARRALVERRIAELKRAIPEGGPREAVTRALLYVRMPEGMVDERGFNLLRRVREEAGRGMSLDEFKNLVREQYFMLQLDEQKCLESIPKMLAVDPELAVELIDRLRRIVNVVGQTAARKRLAEIEPLLNLDKNGSSARRNDEGASHPNQAKAARPQSLGH